MIDAYEVLTRFESLAERLGRETLLREQSERTLDMAINTPAPLSVPALNDLMVAIANERKIEAIKAFRILTGHGLKESKDAVEAAFATTKFEGFMS